MPDEHDRKAAWDQYWASGALHSCPGSYAANYSGAIADFWQPLFRRLIPNSRVLDLATGNAPLPALMVETLGTESLPQITAVDLSHPEPRWTSKLPDAAASRIDIRGGIRMENLPFQDGSYDFVMSQYGFEYADRGLATNELLRVAAASATVAMVCHHKHSRLAEVAAKEVEHITWMLDEVGVLASTQAMLPFVALSGTSTGVAQLRRDENANRSRDQFNQSMQALMFRARKDSIPDALQDMQEFIPRLLEWTSINGAERGRELFEATVANMKRARLRSSELCDYAFAKQDIDEFVAALTKAGFKTQIANLCEGEYLLGWGLVAERT